MVLVDRSAIVAELKDLRPGEAAREAQRWGLGEDQLRTTKPLVGGLVAMILFSHMFGTIIPIDFHILQRGSNHQPDHDIHDFLWINVTI